MPVTALVAPGPEVTMATPTFSVLRAKPSAACTAACSWRTSTWRTLSCWKSASYRKRTAPPG